MECSFQKDKMKKELKIKYKKPKGLNDILEILRIGDIVWMDTYGNKKYGTTKKEIAKYREKTKAKRLKRLSKSIYNINSFFLIAEYNKKNVGFVSGKKRKKYNLMGGLYILPEFQNKGIGKNMMEKLFKWFGDDKNIYLKVLSPNIRATEIYKYMGFNKARDNKHMLSIGGSEIPSMSMVKKAK